MKRRDFLKSAFGAAIAAPFLRDARAAGAAAAPSFHASDRVTLGPRKIDSTRLFIGTGSNGFNKSSAQTRKMGFKGLADHLRYGCEIGLTSWDSADNYGSHPALKMALEAGTPRDKVTILTKSFSRDAAGMRADIERYLSELGTGTIDIFLLHCLQDPDWPRNMRECMDVVREYQDKGVIRSKGVSCHSFGALKAAAKEPWVEIDLARINPFNAVMDAETAAVLPVLREMKAAGKGVIGMKILGAGQLAARADECLQFVLNLDCVDAVTIGCENRRQLDDIVARIGRVQRPAAA